MIFCLGSPDLSCEIGDRGIGYVICGTLEPFFIN